MNDDNVNDDNEDNHDIDDDDDILMMIMSNQLRDTAANESNLNVSFLLLLLCVVIFSTGDHNLTVMIISMMTMIHHSFCHILEM